MRPINLTLDGFQGYRDSQELDLSGVERASITGRVGAGKSSLLDGMIFALYGETRVPTKDGVINTGRDRTTVEVQFVEGDVKYRVSRTLTRSGNSKAYLWRWDDDVMDWVTQGDQDGRVGVTNTAIRDLIGLTWEAFRASVIVEQGKSSGFADASPSERYALLAQIVGLDRYQRLADTASEQRKVVRTAIAQTRTRIEENERLLADSDTVVSSHAAEERRRESLRANARDLDARLKDAQKNAQLTRAQLDLAQQQAHVITARAAAQQSLAVSRRNAADAAMALDRTRQDAATLDSATQAITQAQREKVAAEAEVAAAIADGQKARDALTAAEAAVTRADDEIAVIRERMAGLAHEGDGCFTCRQPLTAQQRAEIVAELTSARDVLVQQKQDLAAEIARATASREEATVAYRAAGAEVNAASARIERGMGPARVAQDATEALPAAEERDAKARAAVSAAQEALDNLPETTTLDLSAAERAWRDAEAAVEQVRAQIATARDSLASTDTNIAVLADRMSRHAVARESITALQAALEQHNRDDAGWSLLIEAYSPAGVPRMILDTAVAELNVDLDAELTGLSGGALTASLDTMRTTKSGTMRSEITLTVVGQDGARVYESFSGGQRFLVDLALHLALTKTLARRNGATLDFLAIDEGWGSIEGEEREAVLRALHDLATEQGALLLAITHVAEVADSFPTRIETEMVGGTSVTTVQ